MCDQESSDIPEDSSLSCSKNRKPVVPSSIEFLLKEVYKCHKEKVKALEQEIKNLQSNLQSTEGNYTKNEKCSNCANSTEFVEEVSAYYLKLLQEKHSYIVHLEKQLSLQKNQSSQESKMTPLTEKFQNNNNTVSENIKRRKRLESDNVFPSKIMKTDSEISWHSLRTPNSESEKKCSLQDKRKNKENKKKNEADLSKLSFHKPVPKLFSKRTTKTNESLYSPKENVPSIQHEFSFVNESPDLFKNTELVIQPERNAEIQIKELELNLNDKMKESKCPELTISKDEIMPQIVQTPDKVTDKPSEKSGSKTYISKNNLDDTLLKFNNFYSAVTKVSKSAIKALPSFQENENNLANTQSIPNNLASQSMFDNCTEQAAVNSETPVNGKLNAEAARKMIEIPGNNSMDETFVDFNEIQNLKPQISKQAIKVGCVADQDWSTSKLMNFPEESINLEEKIDDLNDSFDRLPKKPSDEPEFKYRCDPVRNKEERRKLDGFKCKMCKEYYEGMDLNEEELKLRIKECSRHREKYEPPATPENFWLVDFPSTEECKKRGTMLETQYQPLKPRRRRPLQ